jgi:hypothetical protein
MRLGTLVVAAGTAFAASVLPASAEVQLTMANGQVTLSAKNATPSQILAEWARVGQSQVVNAEHVTGAPLTIELTNVPEAEALDVILRGVGGYVLAPRGQATPDASRYDRIFIVMATTPARPAPPPPPAQQPRFLPPPPPQQQDVDEPPQQPRTAAPAPNPFAGRGFGQAPGATTPAYNTFPATGATPAGAPPAPAPTPGGVAQPAAGVPVPGMVMPAPPQQQGPGTVQPQPPPPPQ